MPLPEQVISLTKCLKKDWEKWLEIPLKNYFKNTWIAGSRPTAANTKTWFKSIWPVIWGVMCLIFSFLYRIIKFFVNLIAK